MMNVFVNATMRRLLENASDARSTLKRLRRKALLSSDKVAAAACLLQQLAMDDGQRAQMRTLRRYVRETGSPLAAHILSTLLAQRGSRRAAADAWKHARLERHQWAADEARVLVMLFPDVLPSDEQQEAFVHGVVTDPTFDASSAAGVTALNCWLASDRVDAVAKADRYERIVQAAPSSAGLHTFGVFFEANNEPERAIRAYRAAAERAKAEGDLVRELSIRAKLNDMARKV